MHKLFAEEHGKAALMVIGATVLAALVVIPIANKFLGAFLPQGSIRI